CACRIAGAAIRKSSVARSRFREAVRAAVGEEERTRLWSMNYLMSMTWSQGYLSQVQRHVDERGRVRRIGKWRIWCWLDGYGFGGRCVFGRRGGDNRGLCSLQSRTRAR